MAITGSLALLAVFILAAGATAELHQGLSFHASKQQPRSKPLWRRLQHSRRMRQLQEQAAAASNRTSRCHADCTRHGVCNEELARCYCPRHRLGEACENDQPNIIDACKKWGFSKGKGCLVEDMSTCINFCNYRGTCISGFCHCRPGYYGADCSLSIGADGRPELLAGQGYTPRKRAPKIYVYELPGEYNLWLNMVRLDRPLYALFWQRLLSSGVRTANGDEADYYFIPVKQRMGYGDSMSLMSAIKYIRETWPWWDKLGGGHRHLIIQTGDMGRGELISPAQVLTDNVTFITHWGLYDNQPYAKWDASHRPGLDIVVPIFLQPNLVKGYGMHASPLHPSSPQTNRTLQFFFAGRICGDRREPLPGVWPNCDLHVGGKNGYSAGTRQKVHYHHGNRTGYKIVTSSKTYSKDMARARFCMAPTGGGHGKRNVLVSMMGCVPVTVTDYVYQPFQPELDWSEFSLHLPEADIPRLHEILDAVAPEKMQSLQSKLRCGAQHMFWSSIYGSVLGDDGRYDAFETVLEILRARLQHPGVPAEKLASVDEDFRKFMACESLPAQEPPDLCSRSELNSTAFPCDQCRRISAGRLLNPGGAICCDKNEIGKCPRLWE